MPELSEELQRQKALGKFSTVSDVSREIFLLTEANQEIRIKIERNYHDAGIFYGASYEMKDVNGLWNEAEFGSILSGNKNEESAIRMAISMVRNRLHLNE